MFLPHFLRTWKRPRTDAEFEAWLQTEQRMNAQFAAVDKGFTMFFQGTERVVTLFEKPDWRERAAAPTAFDRCIDRTLMTPLYIITLTVVLPLVGAALAGFEIYCLYDFLGRKLRRPQYYEAEAKKRAERLAHQRSNAHRVRHRTSWLLPPAPCELLHAWNLAHHRGAVKEKLRLGAMMSVIEAAVDNGLIRDIDGEILGRNPGVKGWLKQHCKDLVPHYSTLMRYKAAADKLEAASGLSDPCPEEFLIAENKENRNIAITVGTAGCPGMNCAAKMGLGSITITVGMDFAKGENRTKRAMATESSCGTLTLRGVKPGVTQEQIEAHKDYLSGCRRNATAVWEDFRSAHFLLTFRAIDDFLYARLGLIREHRSTALPRS